MVYFESMDHNFDIIPPPDAYIGNPSAWRGNRYSNTPDNLLDSARLRFLMINRWDGDNQWSLGGRNEPLVLFFLLHSGVMDCRLGTYPRPLRMQAGDILIVPENTPVDAWTADGGDTPHTCGRFSARIMGGTDLCALLGISGIYPSDATTRKYIQQTLDEYTDHKPGWQANCDALTTLTLTRIIRKHYDWSAAPAQINLKHLQQLQPALKLLEKHFPDPDLRVTDLARSIPCSEVALRQICKRVMGRSPNDMIRQRRIEHACLLLSTTDMPVKAIAPECGFKDPSFFCRSFRKVTGITADSYRQN